MRAQCLRLLETVVAAILMAALFVVPNRLLNIEPSVAAPIRSSPLLTKACDEVLQHWRTAGKCDGYSGWYCSSVCISPATHLANVAPSCHIIRFHIHPNIIYKMLGYSYNANSRFDVAVNKTTGEWRIVLPPWGNDFRRYPDFLVWARCRVQSTADAESILRAMNQSRDGGTGGRSYAVQGEKSWQCWATEDLNTEPRLIFNVDNDGYIISGEAHE